MNEQIEKIKGIYEGYQYSLERSSDNYAVFSLGEGIYPGVDILVSEDMPLEKYEKVRKEYAEAGYATHKVVFHSLETLEESLFQQFFKPESARTKLLSHYKDYTDSVMKPYSQTVGVSPGYKYIEVAYSIEEDFGV